MTTLEMLRLSVESIEMEIPLTLDIPKGMQPKPLKGRIVGEVDRNGRCYVRHQFDAEAVLKWLVESGLVVKKRVGKAVVYRPKGQE
jgi:hypothetical protein